MRPSSRWSLGSRTWEILPLAFDAFDDGRKLVEDLVAGAFRVRPMRLGLGLRVFEDDLASEVLDAEGAQAAHAFIAAVLRARRGDGFLDLVEEGFDDRLLQIEVAGQHAIEESGTASLVEDRSYRGPIRKFRES